MSVYEKEKPDYFDLALRSIYEQTVKPDEIILVEDGPIPESLKNIVKKYQALYGKNLRLLFPIKTRVWVYH